MESEVNIKVHFIISSNLCSIQFFLDLVTMTFGFNTPLFTVECRKFKWTLLHLVWQNLVVLKIIYLVSKHQDTVYLITVIQ